MTSNSLLLLPELQVPSEEEGKRTLVNREVRIIMLVASTIFISSINIYSAPSNSKQYSTVKRSFKLIFLWIMIIFMFSVFFFIVGCIITCICVQTRAKI